MRRTGTQVDVSAADLARDLRGEESRKLACRMCLGNRLNEQSACPDDGDGKHQNAPDQKLALQRVHEILDTMSAGLEEGGKKRPRCEEGDEKGQKKIVADDDIDAASRNRLQSGTVNEGMQLTASLWSRRAR